MLVQSLSFVQPASSPVVISSSKKEESYIKKQPASSPLVMSSSEKEEIDIKKYPGMPYITFPISSYSVPW